MQPYIDEQLLAAAGPKNLDRDEPPETLLISLSYLPSVQRCNRRLLPILQRAGDESASP